MRPCGKRSWRSDLLLPVELVAAAGRGSTLAVLETAVGVVLRGLAPLPGLLVPHGRLDLAGRRNGHRGAVSPDGTEASFGFRS